MVHFCGRSEEEAQPIVEICGDIAIYGRKDSANMNTSVNQS